MDSLTALHWVLRSTESPFIEVKAISFNYGQRHKKELDYARGVCQKLGVEHRVVDISEINKLIKGSALTDDIDVPEGHYASDNMKITVVPNRNAIMISLAVAWASSISYDAVITGVHSGDHAIYPDCREIFISSINTTSQLATDGFGNIKVIAPFVNLSKADIVRFGNDLAVPYEDSWSCYKGGKYHCGKCGTCVERKEAFELAGVEDLTIYEK